MTLPTEHLFADTGENSSIALLKQHFPQCFDKDGLFLPDKLAEQLQTANVPVSREYYTMNWLGKSYARYLCDCPPITLLGEDSAHNTQSQNQHSQNLLIKGDNLEVLKHLKNAYANQVKMIYIDPPYNTGSDGFVYQDDRKFTPDELAKLADMSTDEARRVLDFTAKKSNSHSAWLTFMYPRLCIARELLKDDGVIFISIDDNEQAQLKLLCDEVFGEENFVATIAVKLSEPTGVKMAHADKRIPKLKEYVLCYKKSKNISIMPVMENKPEWDSEYRTVILGLSKKELAEIKITANNENRTNEDVNYVNGVISKCSFDSASTVCKQETQKELSDEWLFENAFRIVQFVTMTGGALRQAKDIKLSGAIESDMFSIVTPKKKMYFIKTDFNHQSDLPRSKILFADEYLQINTGDFWHDIKTTGLDNEGGVAFKNGKKPLKLLNRLMGLTVGKNDLILDFFAGSGTTAHAVMQLNAQDNGNRRFICVQIDEPTDPKSEARKAGYPTIFEITKERIIRSAQKIKSENPDYQGDLGFKIFETMPDFRATDDEISPQLEFPEMLHANLEPKQYETLLTTWCVYDGNALTQSVQSVELGGYSANLCGTTLYVVYPDFDSVAIKALLDKLDHDADFIIERVVLFGEMVESAKQRELKQALDTYNNKKNVHLSLLVRY